MGLSEAAYSQTVQNPFNGSHGAILGDSTAHASYSFLWTGDEASFDIRPQHRLEALDGHVLSTGFVRLSIDRDSLLSVRAACNYSLPPSTLNLSSMRIAVLNVRNQQFFSGARSGGTFDLRPTSGTLRINGDVLLPGGNTYALNYSADLESFDVQPAGLAGNASGQLTFTISPIPEPSTLLLFAPLIAGLVRRCRYRGQLLHTHTLPRSSQSDAQPARRWQTGVRGKLHDRKRSLPPHRK